MFNYMFRFGLPGTCLCEGSTNAPFRARSVCVCVCVFNIRYKDRVSKHPCIPQADLSEWGFHGVGKCPLVAVVIRSSSRGVNFCRHVADLVRVTFVTLTPNRGSWQFSPTIINEKLSSMSYVLNKHRTD